jgi:tetratricopeptide (TPR) repeat protein
LFGLRALLKERTGNAMVIVLLTTLTAVPGLLNLSMSPLALFQPGEHLPVFGSAVFASVTAIAIAACVLFFDPDDATPDETAARDGTPDDDIAVDVDEDLPLAGRIRRVFGGVFLPILLLLALAACWRSYRAMDARRGLFADVTARETLALMKGRTWMISNGYLDNHLRIQAFMLGRPLTLVSLRPNELPFKVEHTGQMIASSPIFAGQNRQRLQNALSISTVRFVREWFTSDPTAGTHAMVLATPDIWTACGYRAVPEGLAFGGVRPGQDLDLPLLDEENRMLVSRLAPLLPKQNQESGYVAALGETIRMKAGFAANELGVALEEMNQTEAAYQAYSRARQIDPMNISATVNGYALANAHGIHPEEQARLRNTIRTLTANRGDQAGGLVGTLQTYGTIRQQAFYKQQAAVWASLGVHAVAVDKNRKALALSEQTGASILVENATFYAHADDSANAEACYLAALKEDASNQAALSGIINLMLVERRPVEAAQWVQKAREAGVEEDVLLYPTIALSILNRNVRQALALLQEATRKHPRDLRYWTLLADLLLNQGDTLLVERTVLPDMQNALKTPNHFLIHTVRGLLLRKKGPSHFKEARLSLLRALSLNAALPEVWNIVFELDLALRNPDFTEMDAKNLLNVNPDHALANYLMGSLLLARGELQKAEDFQRRSIEIFPTATACNDLGENLRRQGRLAEAEVFVRQSLALSPNVPHALDTLACILFDAGQYDASAEAASEAVACQPTTPSYQLTLLRAQIKQGNTNGVARRIQALTEAMADIPDSLREEIATMKLK